MKSRGAGNPGKFSEHFLSKAHNAAFLDYVHFMSNNSQSHVDSLLDLEVRAKAVQLQEDKENNRATIKLMIDLCHTMARQGKAYLFGAHNQTLIAILSSFFPSRQGIVQS